MPLILKLIYLIGYVLSSHRKKNEMHFNNTPELPTIQKNQAAKYVTRTSITSMSRKIPDLGIFSNLTSDMATIQKPSSKIGFEQTSIMSMFRKNGSWDIF
jgi:hypothetical protein